MDIKKIIVVGLGISGFATLDYYLGKENTITAYDMSKNIDENKIKKYENTNINLILGENPTGDEDVDMVLLSPVVDLSQDFVQKYIKRKIIVTGEIELAYKLSKNANFIGITGTNGKTTTTSMLGDIYKKKDENSYVVGNIGNVALTSVLKAKENANFITELSSFQLESIIDFRPHIALIINITPDHIERHKTFELYKKAKYNIAKNQTKEDFLVINKDDVQIDIQGVKSNIIYFSQKEKLENGIYYDNENKVIVSTLFGKKQEIIKRHEINLLGNHNIENTLGAIAVALLDNIDINIIRDGIINFKAVKHRLQLVKVVDGVSYVNDSKGTNVDSTIRAIQAIENPIILIAGGYDKHVDFDEMIKTFDKRVKKLVLFGQTKEKIKNTALKYGFDEIEILDNLKQCVDYCKAIAKKGDTVLLSPACASWDMYSSYEVRGDEFIEIVNSL